MHAYGDTTHTTEARKCRLAIYRSKNHYLLYIPLCNYSCETLSQYLGCRYLCSCWSHHPDTQWDLRVCMLVYICTRTQYEVLHTSLPQGVIVVVAVSFPQALETTQVTSIALVSFSKSKCDVAFAFRHTLPSIARD